MRKMLFTVALGAIGCLALLTTVEGNHARGCCAERTVELRGTLRFADKYRDPGDGSKVLVHVAYELGAYVLDLGADKGLHAKAMALRGRDVIVKGALDRYRLRVTSLEPVQPKGCGITVGGCVRDGSVVLTGTLRCVPAVRDKALPPRTKAVNVWTLTARGKTYRLHFRSDEQEARARMFFGMTVEVGGKLKGNDMTVAFIRPDCRG
jgi:hypothetical protein